MGVGGGCCCGGGGVRDVDVDVVCLLARSRSRKRKIKRALAQKTCGNKGDTNDVGLNNDSELSLSLPLSFQKAMAGY